MQFGPLEEKDKMFRGRKNEQPRGHVLLPIEQVQNAKRECGAAVPSAANSKAAPSSMMSFPQYYRPLAATGASREGSFVVRTNRHGCAGFLLHSEVGDRGNAPDNDDHFRLTSPCGVYPYLPPFPDTCKQRSPSRMSTRRIS
jgi:hypothetical protein